VAVQAWQDDYPWLRLAFRQSGPLGKAASEEWRWRIEEDLKAPLDYQARSDGTAAVWCGLTRYDFKHEPTPKDLLRGLDTAYRQELERRGWSFALQIYATQVPAALQVVGTNESLSFIINHAGMFVDRDSPQGYREWRDGLHRLAARPNTALKLSGFAMFDHHWTVESFRPYVLEAIDAFGTERCMFASNFPIDGLHASYGALWSAYAQIVSGMSAGERENLFVNNAIKYYRLGSKSA